MSNKDFIWVKLGGYKIVHGFDSNNCEIIEMGDRVKNEWTNKIIAVSRIQSITEKYIRMSYSHDRIIYWEYRAAVSGH